jgi:hypothetical protein
MLSGKLISLIETHRDEITRRMVEQIRREPETAHFRRLLDSELRELAEDLLQNLGHWLSSGNGPEMARRYEALGHLRFEQEVPLHECTRALCIFREKILDFVEEHIASNSSVELYAEEELDRRLGRFFDLLLVHLVRGYERGLRRSLAMTA